MSYILGDAKPPLDEALLEHYGVKGMRWGVRRDQAALDRAAGRTTGRSVRREGTKKAYKEVRSESKKAKAASKEAAAKERAKKAAEKAKMPSRSDAKAHNKGVSKSARAAMQEYERANDKAGREAAAKKYEKEVFEVIRSDEFKRSFEKANSVGKGEMLANVLTLGPLAAVTIPAAMATRKELIDTSYTVELAVSKNILKEMQRRSSSG